MVGQLKFRNVFIMFIDESDQNRYEEVSWENNKKYFIYIYIDKFAMYATCIGKLAMKSKLSEKKILSNISVKWMQ